MSQFPCRAYPLLMTVIAALAATGGAFRII